MPLPIHCSTHPTRSHRISAITDRICSAPFDRSSFFFTQASHVNCSPRFSPPMESPSMESPSTESPSMERPPSESPSMESSIPAARQGLIHLLTSIGARNQPSHDDQPPRLPNVWICCKCVSPGEILPYTSPNMFTLVGDDCSICSHNRCSDCDPPKRSSWPPTTNDLAPQFMRHPNITSSANQTRFMNEFRSSFFTPEIPWIDAATAYRAWEWLQYSNGGRKPSRGDATDEWTLVPLGGDWQCCRCLIFNRAHSGEAARNYAGYRQECFRKHHLRCRLCFTNPMEGDPIEGKPMQDEPVWLERDTMERDPMWLDSPWVPWHCALLYPSCCL